MGLIGKILGIGRVAKDVSEVFVPNKTEGQQQAHDRFSGVVDQYGNEFGGRGWFNSFIDAINRLPRPLLAVGTIGLFVFAMASPVEFSVRMAALDLIPAELWWLLGAIVSFYFGARELHHFRAPKSIVEVAKTVGEIRELSASDAGVATSDSPETATALTQVIQLKAKTGNAAVDDYFKSLQ